MGDDRDRATLTGRTRVPRIGITGHTAMTVPTALAVEEEVRRLLGAVGSPLVGVSCLAPGADLLFARVVLDLRGELEVVIPSADYRRRRVPMADARVFDDLLARAATVRRMPFARAGRRAYLAASEAMLDRVGAVLAVWDGNSDPRAGSTADVVRIARARELPVTVVWPDGAERR